MLGWLRRWLRRHDTHDIDGLIHANRARPRPGMEAMDWAKMDRLGARNAAGIRAAEDVAQAAAPLSAAPGEGPVRAADRVH